MNSGDRRSSREEPNRFLGFPIGNPPPGHQGGPPAGHEGAEPQRVMGMPVGWFEPAGPGRLGRLAHPVLEYRRWAERRRRGPDGTDGTEP